MRWVRHLLLSAPLVSGALLTQQNAFLQASGADDDHWMTDVSQRDKADLQGVIDRSSQDVMAGRHSAAASFNPQAMPRGLTQMLDSVDQELERNADVSAPGVGRFYSNAAFFAQAPSLSESFAPVLAQQDQDIADGLMYGGPQLEQNLNQAEADIDSGAMTSSNMLIQPASSLVATVNVIDPSASAGENPRTFLDAIHETGTLA